MSLWSRFKSWLGAVAHETADVEKAVKDEKPIEIAVQADELGDALITANKDETLSERFARWRTEGNPVQKVISKGMCKFLNIFQPGHCDKVLAEANEKKKEDQG